MNRPVVIVGAGILGCSIAVHLVDRGVRPVLIDSDRPGRGPRPGRSRRSRPSARTRPPGSSWAWPGWSSSVLGRLVAKEVADGTADGLLAPFRPGRFAERATRVMLERVYRNAASALLAVEDLREVIGRRELHRRFSRVSETLTEGADRVWSATVKEG